MPNETLAGALGACPRDLDCHRACNQGKGGEEQGARLVCGGGPEQAESVAEDQVTHPLAAQVLHDR
jgi:hypothetical protein